MATRPSDKTADMLDAQHIKMFVNLSVTEADERTVCPVFKMVCAEQIPAYPWSDIIYWE